EQDQPVRQRLQGVVQGVLQGRLLEGPEHFEGQFQVQGRPAEELEGLGSQIVPAFQPDVRRLVTEEQGGQEHRQRSV
ncbi:MAG: hypothetical protein ACMG6E_09245, partial [Candidatus Roizmanbacteria bacterium]